MKPASFGRESPVRSAGSAAIVLAALLCLAEPSRASDGRPGRDAYLRYCSSCHGLDAGGSGVAADGPTTKATDLRRLAKANGGVFPYEDVRKSIDGRKTIAAHGSATMPAWGRVFAAENSYESHEAHASSQIAIIVEYLASIQAE